MASLTASRNPPGERAGAPSTSLPLPRAPRRSPKRRFASLRTIAALILREMTTTYGRSPGGYLWAILEPVAGIALLTAIFAMSFRSPALGDSFPLFYATGMMPFMMFTGIHSKVSQSLSFNRPRSRSSASAALNFSSSFAVANFGIVLRPTRSRPAS